MKVLNESFEAARGAAAGGSGARLTSVVAMVSAVLPTPATTMSRSTAAIARSGSAPLPAAARDTYRRRGRDVSN